MYGNLARGNSELMERSGDTGNSPSRTTSLPEQEPTTAVHGRKELYLKRRDVKDKSHLWAYSHTARVKRSAKSDFRRAKLSEPERLDRTLHKKYLILAKTPRRSWPTSVSK